MTLRAEIRKDLEQLVDEVIDISKITTINPQHIDMYTDYIIKLIEKRIDEMRASNTNRSVLINDNTQFLIYLNGFEDAVEMMKEMLKNG